jgi:hypothetical protein
LYKLQTSSWDGPFADLERNEALLILELGQIIFLPNLLFKLNEQEKIYLTPDILKPGFKNISFDPKTSLVKGLGLPRENKKMQELMGRFFKESCLLINTLLPHYQSSILHGRTSFRPIPIIDRKISLLKDDTLLHVDAFPATPSQGQRILRVFTNIHPHGQERIWNTGEPFDAVVRQFFPHLKPPFYGTRKILSMLKITKSYRSLYDHYMLKLHDLMKKNDSYQKSVKKTVISFGAGTTWVAMTDAVSHAAIAGQHLLEQTFYLPVNGMREPKRSPLKILEKTLKKSLIS